MRFELSLVNYVKVTKRKTFHSNWILRNTHRHQPFDFYEIAELGKTWVSQKRNRAILREMTFGNDCTNCCFFAQNWCAKKEKFCVSFQKNCAKVLRMETLAKTQGSVYVRKTQRFMYSNKFIYIQENQTDRIRRSEQHWNI